jgi:hypothetical protein
MGEAEMKRKKIKVRVFDDLKESLQDALAFEQGREVSLCVSELPDSRGKSKRNLSHR